MNQTKSPLMWLEAVRAVKCFSAYVMGSSYKMATDDLCNSDAADAGTATSETLIKCTELPFLGEHILHRTNCSPPSCNNGLKQIQIGYFYELNHHNLPRRFRIQLKSILVTEKTDYNVGVLKFPSSSSLRTYFRRVCRNEKNQTVGTSISSQEFLTGSKPARDVLARQILPSEFFQRKKLESLEPTKDESNDEPKISSSISSPMVDIPVTGGGGKSVTGGAVLMRLGVRRTFVGKHKEMKINSDPQPVESSLMEPGIKSEEDHEDTMEGIMEQDSTETSMRTPKRKRETSFHSRKTSTAGASIKKKMAGEQGKDQLSYARWSKERRIMEELLKLKSSMMSCITRGRGTLIQQLPVAGYEDGDNKNNISTNKTTTTRGPTKPIKSRRFQNPVAATQPGPQVLRNPETQVPVTQQQQQIPIPRNFFRPDGMRWPGFYYIFVLQFGTAERYMKGWSNYGVVGKPTVHGLWLSRDHNLVYKQDEFQNKLVDKERLQRAWPSFHAYNNDPHRTGVRRHQGFWNYKEWNGHGRKGPMKQKRYFDFVLDTFDHFGPLVAEGVQRSTIRSEPLESNFLDPDAFLLYMRTRGWYPTIHTKARTFTAGRITSRFQALTEVRFYLNGHDPRITLNPAALHIESNYDMGLDINIITGK